VSDDTGNVVALAPRLGKPESATARMERQRHDRFLAKQAEKGEKAAKVEAVREQIQQRKSKIDQTLPRIHLDSDPDAIRALTSSINSNILPDVYVRAGTVVCVETPSGALATEDAPPQIIMTVDRRRLARLLAEHTFTYEIRKVKLGEGESELIDVEVSPKDPVAQAVLASTAWPDLMPLHGIVTAPVFRPDGTLFQQPGYDPVTALIYSPKLPLATVPEDPTTEELRAARNFLLNDLLHDFPFVTPSRANYIGLLVAPLIRNYLGGVLVPLGAIDAASPGTGKTLLTLIMTKIYSGYTRAWVSEDNELRKAITSILVDQGGAVVVLDNVGKADTVDQPALSNLLTSKIWSDRILGASTSARVPNDRVWIVTGNALSIGGDNASRSVPVRLDAAMPDPSQRPASKFALGDLEEWLESSTNRATLLHHLLVLVRGWIVAGAKAIETPMRTFTTWASATAGFLDWLAEPGFMQNRAWLAESDDEETAYGAFYHRWHQLFGDRKLRAAELRATALPDPNGTTQCDWRDTFLVRKRDGQIPPVGGLTKMLTADRGRFRGGYRLDAEFDSHSKVWSFSVSPAVASEPAVAE
jgi:hypothetical protein